MKSKKSIYYPFLDGIRAIAAMMVAFSHSLLIFKLDRIPSIEDWQINRIVGMQSLIGKILLIPFNGEAAVVMFFLISSLVVGQSLEKNKIDFKSNLLFIIKRFIRLYPTYLATFLISLFILFFFYNSGKLSITADWYNNWFSFLLTKRLFLENLSLRSVGLNINAWTLQIEFVVMFLFPLMVFVKQKTNLIFDLFLVLISFILGWRQNQYLNLVYIFPFYIGLLITKWGPEIFRKKIFLSRASLYLALILLLLPTTISSNPHLRVVLETAGGFLIIGYLVYADDNKVREFLVHKYFRAIGKISYAFYLLNSFILYLLTFIFLKYLIGFYNPSFALFFNLNLGIISALLTIPTAFIIHRLIEKPSIELAKTITKKTKFRL